MLLFWFFRLISTGSIPVYYLGLFSWRIASNWAYSVLSGIFYGSSSRATPRLGYFNSNFPMNIPDLFILWESPRGLFQYRSCWCIFTGSGECFFITHMGLWCVIPYDTWVGIFCCFFFFNGLSWLCFSYSQQFIVLVDISCCLYSGAFSGEDVTHVEGEVDPVRDLGIISEELRQKVRVIHNLKTV